jgi:hypothetical protein
MHFPRGRYTVPKIETVVNDHEDVVAEVFLDGTKTPHSFVDAFVDFSWALTYPIARFKIKSFELII